VPFCIPSISNFSAVVKGKLNPTRNRYSLLNHLIKKQHVEFCLIKRFYSKMPCWNSSQISGYGPNAVSAVEFTNNKQKFMPYFISSTTYHVIMLASKPAFLCSNDKMQIRLILA